MKLSKPVSKRRGRKTPELVLRRARRATTVAADTVVDLPEVERRIPAISVYPVYAWLIVNGYKDFENRSRKMGPAGLYYVHASRVQTQACWDEAVASARLRLHREVVATIPLPEELEKGGIVGVMRLGAYREHISVHPWSDGAGYGILWASRAPLVRCAGKQGIFYPGITVPGICRVCGCTEHDCRWCIQRTGKPCSWTEVDLCSACAKPVRKGGGR